MQTLFNKMKINPETGCWEWQGALNNQGYAYAQLDGKVQGVHRWIYCTFWDETPQVVKHSCNNKKCVNINHLSGGSQSSNIKEAFAQNPRSTGIPKATPKMDERAALFKQILGETND